MATLDDIVQLTITIQDSSPSRAGFGTPMIMTHETSLGTASVASFKNTQDMVTAGFSATGPTVAAASAVFGQNPRPPTLKVGLRPSAAVSQSIRLTPIVIDSTLYTVTINGTAFTFTSDATATASEITAGLTSAINLGSEPVTATDNIGTIDLDADVAGDLFTLAVDRKLLTQDDLTADAGIAADYAAIKLVDNDFYGVLMTSNASLEIAALATPVEADRKIFGAVSADDDILSDAGGNLAETLNNAAFQRTFLTYHQKPHQYAAAAWMGNRLPSDPGSSTWSYKTLTGVDFTELTGTEITNLDSNNVNRVVRLKGLNMALFGVMAGGRFTDITRGVDFLFDDIQTRVLTLLKNSEKVPYTDEGVALVEKELRASLTAAIGQGILSSTPEPTVTVPLVADVAQVDRANRLLPDMEFAGTLAGAIHKVVIQGLVSI